MSLGRLTHPRKDVDWPCDLEDAAAILHISVLMRHLLLTLVMH